MEIKQLRYFKAITDAGSFSEAARRLNMSQPPLSYQIKLLEEELQTPLFDRQPKGVQLTDAGQLLYERALSLLHFNDSTVNEIHELGKEQNIRIGLTPTTVPIFTPYIAQFHNQFPKIKWDIYEGSTYELIHLIENDMLDLSALRTPSPIDRFEKIAIQTEPMILARANQQNILRVPEIKAKIKMTAALNDSFIIYERYKSYLMQFFAAEQLEPRILCECGDARTALTLAREGLGTAFVPKSMLSACYGLDVFELDESQLLTQIYLVWPFHKTQPTYIKNFIRTFKNSEGAN